MNNLTLQINGSIVSTTYGKTILEVVQENNLDSIPTLCEDKRLEHFTSCFLCVVEMEDSKKLLPSCSTLVSEGMKIRTNSPAVIDSRKTALELIMSNHYADCIGPCKAACPAGVSVQDYVALIANGEYREALKLVKENNPLPLSICRVCVRDCEAACRRNSVDEPVAVNSLKRFIADLDAPAKWIPEIKKKNGYAIAIVGSGPAGLTAAYYLVLQGFDVTVFEKYSAPGGMLRYGIPEYRLPEKVLDDEIRWIEELGITVNTNSELGKDFSIAELQNRGYSAVFLAVGAHQASKLGLDGELAIRGIFRGIDFLHEVQTNRDKKLEGTVVVVGGGNTAIDSARTALRCGADKVQIVYRRSLHEMPAHHEEIDAALKEGIEILFLTNPKRLLSENNILTGIECLKMRLEEGKAGERPRPVQVEGSEFIVPCNYLISAIGQNVDTNFASRDSLLQLSKWGTITINPETMETSIPGVFAGGDAVTGPFTAISSIAQGKKAASAIMKYVHAGKPAGNDFKYFSFKHKIAAISEIEFAGYEKLPRARQDEIEVLDRVHCFKEVEKGFTEEQSIHEAERCLECGCTEYADCRLRKYCDEYAIDVSAYIGETRKYKIDDSHPFIVLDPNKCINCGKCVRTCSEVLNVSALGFVYRGFKSIVKPAMEMKLSETNCISCGNCIDVCPTGAISEKLPFKIMGTMDKENIVSVCNFCSLGCKLNFKKISNEIIFVSNATLDIQDTHNQGFLCAKGRFGHRYLLEKNRVKEAVIRRNGLTHTVAIEEALLYTARSINQIIGEYGNDAVAIMASPKLSNEELYLLQKFARVGLQNNNIDSFGSMLYALESSCLDTTLGYTGSTVRFEELDKADIIVIVNANLSDDFLPLALKIKKLQKKGTKVIVVGSTETRQARSADLWLDCKKGSGTVLLSGMMKRCLESGSYDAEFIAGNTKGFESFANQIRSVSDETVLFGTGLSRDKFDLFSEILQVRDSNLVFIYNLDSTVDKSVNDVTAIGNFLLMQGKVGKPGNGLLLLREYNNSAGVHKMGASPDYLPGAVAFTNKKAIGEISRFWNSNMAPVFRPVDILKKIKRGDIKALLLFGEDPLLDKNNLKYFSKIEFMMVSDAFENHTMRDADVIVPANRYTEYEGTYTRCDGVEQSTARVNRGTLPLTNLEIIQKLAAMFSGQFTNNSKTTVNWEILDLFERLKGTGNTATGTKPESREPYTFGLFDLDLSTYESGKPALHYQENYYFSSIKKQLL